MTFINVLLVLLGENKSLCALFVANIAFFLVFHLLPSHTQPHQPLELPVGFRGRITGQKNRQHLNFVTMA